MKQFFYITFGGLAAIGVGIGIAYGGYMGWKVLKPHIAVSTVASISNKTGSKTNDGTSISGLARTVRFSADEEEDIINAAAQALPAGADSAITAGAYVVRNISGSNNAAQYNSDKLLPMASLTKLITAVIAGRLLDPDQRITINNQTMATYGNTAAFRVGETFRVADMYYPLLMVSSNDAAEALAQAYGRKKFIQAMNDFTQSIGAYRTYVDDPSGLSANNVSTANDLVTILSWIRENNPNILAITGLKSKTVRDHTWTNPTHFLSWSNYLGGKNGYTTEANRTGVGLFSVGKTKAVYAVVVLGSDSRDKDVIKLLEKVGK